MAEEIRKASQIADPSEMIAAINTVTSKVNKLAQARMDQEVKKRQELETAQKTAADGFQVQAADVLGKAWKELVANADKLTTVPMFIFRVERGEDGKLGQPTFIVGKVTKVTGNSTGATRNFKVTVDSKEYGSVAQAWKALMVTNGTVTPAPSKSASGLGSYTLTECQPLMEKAGHKFS